jgi:hypothetical protein
MVPLDEEHAIIDRDTLTRIRQSRHDVTRRA